MREENRPVGIAVKISLLTLEVLGLIPGLVNSNAVSPTTRRRSIVFLKLCCSSAKPRRWAPQVVTRFGVTPGEGVEDLILIILFIEFLREKYV